MRFLFQAIIFFLFFSCESIDNNKVEAVSAAIEEVRQEYVIDKRTALFNVEAKQDNGAIVLIGETIFPEAKSKLLSKVNPQNFQIIDSIEVLPAKHLDGKIYGVVSISVCNIRSNPRHSAEMGTQAILGTPLRVYKKKGDFYYIQTPDNYLGWVDDGGLSLMDAKEFEAWLKSDRAVCMEDYVFAYEEPTNEASKVTDLLSGNIVQVIDNQEGFTKIRLPDGRTGFVKSSKLTPYENWMASRYATPEKILATAEEFMGRPYLWGGTSGKGLDCSGFTKTVYYLNGIQLERDASLQVHTGELVETDTTLKNMEPGDLLFFGRKATENKRERVTHVAIYMGDGKIIHASDRVKVESMKRGDPTFVEYRLTSFIRAKRIIGSEGKNGIIALRDSPWYQAVEQ